MSCTRGDTSFFFFLLLSPSLCCRLLLFIPLLLFLSPAAASLPLLLALLSRLHLPFAATPLPAFLLQPPPPPAGPAAGGGLALNGLGQVCIRGGRERRRRRRKERESERKRREEGTDTTPPPSLSLLLSFPLVFGAMTRKPSAKLAYGWSRGGGENEKGERKRKEKDEYVRYAVT